MKKRLISFLLAVSMMLSILPMGAFADYSTRKQVMLKRVSANSDYFIRKIPTMAQKMPKVTAGLTTITPIL